MTTKIKFAATVLYTNGEVFHGFIDPTLDVIQLVEDSEAPEFFTLETPDATKWLLEKYFGGIYAFPFTIHGAFATYATPDEIIVVRVENR